MAPKSEKPERNLPEKHNPLMVGDVIPECRHLPTSVASPLHTNTFFYSRRFGRAQTPRTNKADS